MTRAAGRPSFSKVMSYGRASRSHIYSWPFSLNDPNACPPSPEMATTLDLVSYNLGKPVSTYSILWSSKGGQYRVVRPRNSSSRLSVRSLLEGPPTTEDGKVRMYRWLCCSWSGRLGKLTVPSFDFPDTDSASDLTIRPGSPLSTWRSSWFARKDRSVLSSQFKGTPRIRNVSPAGFGLRNGLLLWELVKVRFLRFVVTQTHCGARLLAPLNSVLAALATERVVDNALRSVALWFGAGRAAMLASPPRCLSRGGDMDKAKRCWYWRRVQMMQLHVYTTKYFVSNEEGCIS